tara:strand:- start:280 stop:885 length:606 start_codon:yes stop_codon:yes gene_type:complete
MIEPVLITGASRGLGLYLADKFEREGYPVLKHNGKQHFDLSQEEQLLELVEEAKKFGVKILINNASIKCPGIVFENYEFKSFEKIIEVNLLAPIKLSYLLFKDLNSIININSVVGLEIKPFRTLYSASKYGLRGFSNSLKEENKEINILDVYTSSFSGIDPKKHMKIDIVVDGIYKAFKNKKKELIIDGRKGDNPIIKYSD